MLDTLALNDGTTYILESLTLNPPKKKPEWISGADSDGAVLGRDPLFENREIVAKIRVVTQATKDLALSKIAAISDKLEEAERQENGVNLVWTPADGTLSVTFKCLSGEITEMPIVVSGEDAGWFPKSPVVTVSMTCLPFGYGSETVLGGSSSTLPMMTVELTSIPGDVPAEGRLIITDAATQSRRHVEWGLESRFYPTSSPPGLILDSDSLVTSGFAGAGATRTGAYDPGGAGNSVIRLTLLTNQVSAMCGTGNQTHVGTFRVKARVFASTGAPSTSIMRLAWQQGDGPMRTNSWTSPVIGGDWSEVDLGIITIGEVDAGTQRWTGRVEAYTTGQTTDTLDIDYLLLMPAGEGYGVARSTYAYSPGVVVGHDNFTGTTAGGALNTRVAPAGGSWATSGGGGDFLFHDLTLDGARELIRRTDTSGGYRYAVLGTTNYTDTEVGVNMLLWLPAGAFDTGERGGVFARWTDANNHLKAVVTQANGLQIYKVVAGVQTLIGSPTRSAVIDFLTWYTIRLVAYPSGRAYATLLDSAGGVIQSASASDTVIATGGTLQTGEPGIIDTHWLEARYYDTFYAATPAAEPIALYSGRSFEVRSTTALRADSTGTYYGPPPSYRGSRFYVPPAGTRSRKTRVAVKAKRSDVQTQADANIADNLTVSVAYTPRYLVVPR